MTLKEMQQQIKDELPEHKADIEKGEMISNVIMGLIKARIENDISIKRLSEMCGVKERRIDEIEAFDAEPKLGEIIDIAYALGLKLEVE